MICSLGAWGAVAPATCWWHTAEPGLVPWQPAGNAMGNLPGLLQAGRTCGIWVFLPSRPRWCRSYRRGHGDLDSGDARSQPCRSRCRRARSAYAPAARHAGPHARAGGEPRPAGRRPVGRSATLGSPRDVAVARARLRRDLPVAEVVRTGRHGYLLDLEKEAFDSQIVRARCRRCWACPRPRAPGRGQLTARGALDLWRGTPYAEFVGCEPLEAEAERLGGLRLDALERKYHRRPGAAQHRATGG